MGGPAKFAAKAALIGLMFVGALFGQQAGIVRGVLTDSSGAVVPAAPVTLAGSTQPPRSVDTQTDGSFAFVGILPADYTLRVEIPGFTPLEKAVRVEAGRTVDLPLQLAISTSRQEVTVQAEQESVVLSLDPSQNSATTLSGATLDALPDNTDDLTTMLTLLAGPSSGFGGGSQILLDGFSGSQLPPKAAIKEVRIDSNPFSAAYDSLGIGRIEIVTKPGGGTIRGSIGFNDSHAYFNSRNPYAANKADYVNQMFTGTVSGPIGKRVSYSLNLNRNILNNTALINAVTLDPVTLVSVPVGSTVVTPLTSYEGSARMDAQLNANNTLMARYQRNQNDRDNGGIGQYSLATRAYSSAFRRNEIQLTESWAANSSTVVETRFSYWQNLNHQFDTNTAPGLIVSGSFSAGGAQVGNAYSDSRQFEFQNNTSKLHGAHSFKFGFRARRYSQADYSPNNFGGTFLFFGVQNAPVLDANFMPLPDGSTANISSLEQYRRTLYFQKAGLPVDQIRALGGGASQFTIAGGQPLATVEQVDTGIYALDDWRVKPTFTLSVGLRYEAQTNLNHFGNFGPRFGIAWSPRAKNGAAPNTVIRAGIGLFYQRVGSFFTLQQDRFNGVNQQQFVITNPDFFPAVPSLASLDSQRQPGNIYRVDPGMKALGIVESAVTLERTLRKGTTLSANYIQLKATHLNTSVNINTPLPGTYIPGVPSSGVRPLGNAAGNVFEYESPGVIKQNVFWMTLREQISNKVSFNLDYQYLNSRGNIDSNSPSNPYNYQVDYARSSFARKNNLSLIGNFLAPGKITFSPLLVVSSGQPYDLTIGSDRNGDTLTNDRPAFATDLTRPSVVRTRFGNFDTDPLPGQVIVPRNYLTAAGMWNLNMRVGRTFQLGRLKPVASGAKSNGERRYNINFNVDVNNVFNHVNQGGWVGNLASPLFGQSTSLFLLRDTSNNRRVQFGTQFNF